MRSIYHSVGRCFFAVYLLVTMTQSALGPRLGFRGLVISFENLEGDE